MPCLYIQFSSAALSCLKTRPKTFTDTRPPGFLVAIDAIYEAEWKAGFQRPTIQVALVQITNTLYLIALDSPETATAVNLLSEHAFSGPRTRMNQPSTFPPLVLALAEQSIIVASFLKDFDKLLDVLQDAVTLLGSDGALELLDTFSKVFKSDIDIIGVSTVYGAFYNCYISSDVRAATLERLSDSLEAHSQSLAQSIEIGDIAEVGDLVVGISTDQRLFAGSPAFVKAWVKFSGWVIRMKAIRAYQVDGGPAAGLFAQALSEWAALLKMAADDCQVKLITQTFE
jgi:hypothetical protein